MLEFIADAGDRYSADDWVVRPRLLRNSEGRNVSSVSDLGDSGGLHCEAKVPNKLRGRKDSA